MIPRKLEVEGLHSYREAVIVDFDRAVEDGLFGIVGPTGSGKSTLLDAMTLALYGTVDRLGGREKAPMLNVDADELTVTYGFELGGTAYQAHRRFVRSGDSVQQREAELRDLDAGETLASQAREVTREVQTRLGMDFEQFTRAVFLPQGKFARFLEDTPGERLELLEEVFGLDRYGEALRRRARQRRDAVRQRQDKLEGSLEGLEEVSEDTVTRLEAEVDAAAARVEALEERERELGRTAETARGLQSTLEKLEEARQRLDALDERREAIEAKRERLERAKAAREPHATLEDLEEQREALDEVRETLEEVEQQAETRATALDEARKARAEREEALAEREATLDEVRARLEALDAEADRLDELREDREAAQAILDEIDEDAVDPPPEGVLDAHDADALARRIEDGRRAREAVDRREEELEETLETRGGARLALAEKQQAHQTLEEEIQALEDELEAAENELREARVADRARALVPELADGEPCPVCGALEHPDPAEAPEAPIEELEERRDALQEKLSQRRDERARVEQAIETESERLAEARAAAERARKQLAPAREDLAEHRAALPDPLVEEGFQKARGRLRAWRRARRLDEARERLEAVEARLDQARERFGTVAHTLDLEADEPTAEALAHARERFEEARQAVEDEREQLDEQVEEADQALEEVRETASKLAGQEETLAERVETLAGRLDEQIDAAGLEDAEAVRTAHRGAEERERLEDEVEAFEEDLREVEDEVERLEDEGDEAEIEPDEAREAVEAHEAVKARLSSAQERLGEARNALATERERLEEKHELVEARAEVQQVLERAERLTQLLGGRRFVEFLARDRFEAVLGQASRRLAQVSGGQYELEGSPSEIRVVDHMAGSEERDLRTLSGGETFVVSLSLALALSDAIQHERGGGYPPIEFFFLDEGFGSLDQDTLDQVMRMLHELVEQDLCVGLITHVEDAKRYVPRQVVVEPPTEERGSRVEVRA